MDVSKNHGFWGRNSRLRFTIVLTLFLATTWLYSHPVTAATIIVSNTNDGGPGSLRQAIASSAPGDTIIINVTGTITLTNGELLINKDLTINGLGSSATIIDGNNIGRIFDLQNGAVVISGVTIRGGNSGLANGGGGILMNPVLATDNVSLTLSNTMISSNSATFGGGILKLNGSLIISNSTLTGNNTSGVGAGIFNNLGTMTLTNVTIGMNVAGGDAGGIYNGGLATLNSVTISGNSSAGDGGGISSGGAGTINLSNSTIINNSANRGGGIFANGTETVTNSTISANSATLQGGGIINFTDGTIIDSTISGNSTTNQGGGIFTGGSLLLTNATISGNVAGMGGGIFSFGTETLTNVTVNGNNASDGGGIFNSLETLSLRNSIVASNLGGNCSIFSGSITSLGHNLDSENSCAFTGAGDLVNTNPLLAPLALNAPGTTQTHALLPGSPAIDAADPVTFPSTDQRGVTRPQGAAPDIGAYEVVPYAVWSGDISFALKITSQYQDASGNTKFKTRSQPFAGTIQALIGENGLVANSAGNYIEIRDNAGTLLVGVKDVSTITTNVVKSKSNQLSLIGTGNFNEPGSTLTVKGIAYMDAHGTIKKDNAGKAISMTISAKIGGGVNNGEDRYLFSGNLNGKLTPQ